MAEKYCGIDNILCSWVAERSCELSLGMLKAESDTFSPAPPPPLAYIHCGKCTQELSKENVNKKQEISENKDLRIYLIYKEVCVTSHKQTLHNFIFCHRTVAVIFAYSL